MLATTHFAATTSLLLAARQLGINLTSEVIVLTYTFGNLIDLDHLIFYPKQSWQAALEFIKGRGQKSAGQYHLHSKLQEPFFAVIVWMIALVGWQCSDWPVLLLPAGALTLHVFLDSLMRFKNYLLWPFSKRAFHGWIPSNTLVEYVGSIILSIVVIYLSFKIGLFSFLCFN